MKTHLNKELCTQFVKLSSQISKTLNENIKTLWVDCIYVLKQWTSFFPRKFGRLKVP